MAARDGLASPPRPLILPNRPDVGKHDASVVRLYLSTRRVVAPMMNAARRRLRDVGMGALDMDRFIHDQNVKNYRRLLAGNLPDDQRRRVASLLAEEEAKANRAEQPSSPDPPTADS